MRQTELVLTEKDRVELERFRKSGVHNAREINRAHVLVRRRREDKNIMSSFPLFPVILYIAFILPYIIFSLVTIGHPFPATFAAKEADFAWYRESYVKLTALYFFLDNPAAAVFFLGGTIWGAIRLFRERLDFLAGKEALVLGWPLCYLVVSAALTPMPFHFCRYQIPVLPFMMLVAVMWGSLIIKRAMEWNERGIWGRRAAYTVYCLLIAGAVAGHVGFRKGRPVLRWPEFTARSADNIYSLHVRLGKWLKDSTDKDALVATQDIGAMGYYSDREILDVVGLVTPEVLPYVSGKGSTPARSSGLFRFLKKKKPDYLAIFPSLYPGLADNRNVFMPVQKIYIPDNQIAAGNRMVMFRCRWRKTATNPTR